MGKRGPSPTPTNALKLRGSWRAKSRKNEPDVDVEKPLLPSWLTADAKIVWRQLSRDLESMGVLAKVDKNVLIRYCDMFARWKKCAAYIAKNGEANEIITGKSVYRQQHPEVGIYNKLTQQLLRIEQEFGLTPSARSRISLPEKPKQNDKSKFFKTG